MWRKKRSDSVNDESVKEGVTKTMKVLGNRNLFLLVSVAVALTFGVYGPANADEMSELSELRE